MTGRRSILFRSTLLSVLAIGCGDSNDPGNSPDALLAVSGGDDHACLLLHDGAAHCWGWGGQGQLGPGDTLDYNTPTKVIGGLEFKSISAGSAHTCGLTSNGTAYCWGGNAVGALGDGDQVFRSKEPTPVLGGLHFGSISAGTGYTCGVTTNNLGYCWGSGTNGELGNGVEEDAFEPVPVSGGLKFKDIVTSLFHTCGLTTGGAAYCWGDNQWGEIGNASTSNSTTPKAVAGNHIFKSIGLGDFFTCGLTEQGKVYCWGSNVSFELGNGSSGIRYTTEPTSVYGNPSFTAVAVGSVHACGLTKQGALFCWGANTYGKLGNGTETATVIPVAVAGSHRFTAVTAGGNHTCALTADEGAFCWGWNRLGQLGIGSRQSMTSPSQVSATYLPEP
jgi:alpha-tubulin suppressor-like RCC1 family protein